jgi:hypothetical protein
MPHDADILRTYLALFERMLPSDAILAAAKVLRFMADEIKRQVARDGCDDARVECNGPVSNR